MYSVLVNGGSEPKSPWLESAPAPGPPWMAHEREREREREGENKNWAKRWGEDEPDACQLHRTTYSFLQRHIMGITAAPFVWEPEDDMEEEAPAPEPHGGAPSSAAPPTESAELTGTVHDNGQHHAPEGEEGTGTTTAGTRKRIRRKTAQSETDEELN